MYYVFGECTLDIEGRELYRTGQRLKLRPKVFDLLAYLLRHRDRVVPKHELLEQLWPGQFVGDAVLLSCVKGVRQAVGDSGQKQHVIRTLHGHGYRFVAAVESHDKTAADVVAATALLSLPAAGIPDSQPQQGEITEVEPHFCTVCHHPQPPGALFCIACGTRLAHHSPSSSVSPTTAVVATPDVPAPTLESEHKLVTVLCCTLAEAPVLAARLGPEAMHRLMQAFMAQAQHVVQQYEGTILAMTGDGLTVLFGAPVAQEDHAPRAVLSAIALRQRLPGLVAATDAAADKTLTVCLGVHTGPVVIGGLRHEPQRLYTATGQTTALATQIQQQAPPGTILISESTQQLVVGDIAVAAWGSLDSTPLSPAVRLYAVHGVSQRRAGVRGRGARTLSRFVGRGQELAMLQERVTQVSNGQGQAIGIVGEPGLGKSRLLYEFRQRLSGTPVTYYAGHCVAYGRTTPYLPVRDLVKQLCGLIDTEPTDMLATRAQRHLQEVGIFSEEAQALLLQLLDVPIDMPWLAHLSPQARRLRTFALLQRLVLHDSQRQPLILAVENLHWIDATSEEWLTSLVGHLVGKPILLLATYRPGYCPPWFAQSVTTQLALPRLLSHDSLSIVQSVLQTTQLPAELIEEIVTKAAGNPFFLEELAWTLKELGRDSAVSVVPDTIQAVLAARIDRLPAATKRILQAAAVIGADVPLPLLHALTDLPEDVLAESLEHLRAMEFLYEVRPVPAVVYTFKHALTQEVAYGSLLQARQRALHVQIVDIIETRLAEQLEDQLEQLAHHAIRGEVWDKALTYCWQAGQKAAARSAYREAVATFEQALSALQHLPTSAAVIEQAIDLHLDLRNAFVLLGTFDRILPCLSEAARLAEAIDDHRRLGRISLAMTIHFFFVGDYDQAIATGQRALALAERRQDVPLQAVATYHLGRAYQSRGDYQRAIEFCARTVTYLPGEWRYEPLGQVVIPAIGARAVSAWALAETGAFSAGLAIGEEGLRLAEAAAHPASLIMALCGVGLLYLRRGDCQAALPHLERARRICHEADLPFYLTTIAPGLGGAYILAGRGAEARQILEQAVQQGTAMGRMSGHALLLAGLSEALLLTNQHQDATTLARQALELSITYKEHGNQAVILWLLGDIEAQRQAVTGAESAALYHQALTLAEALGMRPLQAHCYFGLGTLYERVGQLERADTALSTAITLYHDLIMPFWSTRAETTQAQMPLPHRQRTSRLAGKPPFPDQA